MTLALAAVLAQADGGVWQYDRAALLLPSGAVVTVDAGVALDSAVAIARAQELERARSTQATTPQWVTMAAAVVAAGVYAADQIRRWVQPP